MTRVSDLMRLGLAHDKAGRHAEAAEAYREVIRLEPGNVDAMHLLGLALFDAGDAKGGREYIERAVSARPYNAIFCHHYATIASSFGEHEVAESYFRRAIELKPTYAEAYLGLSGTFRAQRDDRLLDGIEQLLVRDGLNQQERAALHFAAGKLADDIDEPDRAFGHFLRGNKAAARPFDRDGHAAATANLRHVFTRDLFARLQGTGSDSDAMIFVVGMPRSGTTLIEQMVGSHPLAYAAGERHDMAVIADLLPRHDPQGRPFPECVPHIGSAPINGFARSCLSKLARRGGSAIRYVDKNPLNFSYLGLIALLFPRARILHCRRDPVDTCLSCYFQYFERVDFSFDLADIAAVYRDYRQLMDHWRDHLPLPILDVDYEHVVADYGTQCRRIVEFCGLPWDDACLGFQTSDNAVRTASRWQVRQPIYDTSVARARKYEAHLAPLLEGLAPYLDTV